MTRLFATVGILALGCAVVAGEPSPAPRPSQLVAQLGSEDYREREAAVRALTQAGPHAIPALREAAKSDDPEVRQRAAAVLLKLQRAETSRERLAAKTVRLDYEGVPLGTAFADLRKQTGLNLALDPARLGDPLRKVTCSTREVTVWEALDAFCAAAELREEFRDELEPPKRPHPLGGGYGGFPTPSTVGVEAVPITLIAGKPLRVVGDRRTAVRVLVLPSAFPGHRVTLGTGETTLCLDITPAPGLNWQEVSAVKISRVIDDEGRSGRAANPKASSPAVEYMDWAGPAGGRVIVFGGPGMGGQFGGQLGGQFGGLTQPRAIPNPRVHPVPLKLATSAARSLRRLEGSVFGEITLPSQTLITVSEPEKNLGVAFDGPGDVRLTVVSLNKAEQGVKAQLLLEYPSAWTVSARRGFNPGGIWPEYPNTGHQLPSVQALDATGKPMTVTDAGAYPATSADGQTSTHRFEWTFAKGAGAPAKFVVVGPRPLVVEVPFTLENVPLP